VRGGTEPGALVQEKGDAALPSDLRNLREGGTKMKLLRLALAAAGLVVLLALAAPVTAATTQPYHATFVEIGGAIPGGSCGSATISELGHVAHQCVFFDACGPNCELRTITFDDGSTLVIHESIVGSITPGKSSAAGANAPQFLEITMTIVGGTGRFTGATGGGTGRVNLAAGAVITGSGTITLP
jgi:hypothetical protein